MVSPRVRLDARAVFCRTAFWCFVVIQATLLLRGLKWGRPRHILAFLLASGPLAVLIAVFFGGMLTLLGMLLVELIVRPLVSLWHAPKTDVDAGQFHLASNEWVIESIPARRSMGWRWPPGTLIRTNLRLWFVPVAHDEEVWSQPLDSLASVRLEPAPRAAWGLIRDWPERLAVRGPSEAEPVLFAVAEPASVLGWFGTPRTANAPSSSY